MQALPNRAAWLIAGAVTAAVWPAVAVVAGHLGSALLGIEEARTSALRAAIGFTSAVGGALVMAPAFTLMLVWLTRLSHEEAHSGRAGSVAMGLIWPTWATGVILVVPPLLGFGPELGEAIWGAFVLIVAWRLLGSFGADTLGVRRRWRWRFVTLSTALYFCTFVVLAIAPAFLVRNMLGATTPIEPDTIVDRELPRPSEPNW